MNISLEAHYDDFSNLASDENDSDDHLTPGPSHSVKKSKKNIYTQRLIGALDNCDVTDRDAIHVIAAVLNALDLIVDDYILSRSSLRIYRTEHRGEISKHFSENVKVF